MLMHRMMKGTAELPKVVIAIFAEAASTDYTNVKHSCPSVAHNKQSIRNQYS